MERSEISAHEARAYCTLVAHRAQWLTARELAERSRIAPRTARAIGAKLSQLGLLDVAEVFPGRRYRLSPLADRRNQGYLRRLEQACLVFGLGAGGTVDAATRSDECSK